jgi:mannose-1-phosphate guanylyltransferase
MIYGLIMAGGKGERFWPLSREKRPKQFLKLYSENPLIVETFNRLKVFISEENIKIITGESLKDAFFDLNFKEESLIIEPFGMNTLYAIALSSIYFFNLDKDAFIYAFPSDHFIGDENSFIETMKKVEKIKDMDALVTFGISPTRPETGYGYIEIGEEIEDRIYRVKRFTEKPNLRTAKEFIKSGNFFWNSGMFFFKAETMIDEIIKFQPHLKEIIDKLLEDFNNDNILRFYSTGNPISIDYGVMERSDKVYMVKAEFPWDDIGTWNALERIKIPDEKGNISIGDVNLYNCSNSVFFSQNGVILAEGLKNFIVVHTEDATLVIPKSKAAELKMFLKDINKKYL